MTVPASEKVPPASPLDVTALNCRYSDGQGAWEELIAYGQFRYHLFLEFNRDEKECPENDLLKNLSMAVTQDDDDAIEYWADECRFLVWPLVKNDYASKSSLDTVTSKPCEALIKIQGKTIAGSLQPLRHNRHLKYPLTSAIENTFPGVPTFRACELVHVEELEHDILKVEYQNCMYCMKSVHRTGNEDNFVREVSTLRRCSHQHIITFFGLVVDEEDKVEGMLIEYIDNAKSLAKMESFSIVERERWSKQMEQAIHYLHTNGLVWGDVKPANVLIRENGNIVLIDFGGGATKGWVDIEYYETKRGDLQGLERIIKFMKENTI